MQSASEILIDLRQASKSESALQISLSDDFFTLIGQDEISGGHLAVNILVKEQAYECFVVNLSVEGEVTVPCDRCMEALTLPIEAEGDVKVYAGDSDYVTDDDVKTPIGGGYKYDLAWDIFETTLLSLPLQRVHDIEDCNPEMVAMLSLEDDEEEDD